LIETPLQDGSPEQQNVAQEALSEGLAESLDQPANPVDVNKLHIREPGNNTDDEVHVKLR